MQSWCASHMTSMFGQVSESFHWVMKWWQYQSHTEGISKQRKFFSHFFSMLFLVLHSRLSPLNHSGLLHIYITLFLLFQHYLSWDEVLMAIWQSLLLGVMPSCNLQTGTSAWWLKGEGVKSLQNIICYLLNMTSHPRWMKLLCSI
jgi:hypothetical protein